MTKAIDGVRIVDVVFMYFSKAFDNVPHIRPIQKVKLQGSFDSELVYLQKTKYIYK